MFTVFTVEQHARSTRLRLSLACNSNTQATGLSSGVEPNPTEFQSIVATKVIIKTAIQGGLQVGIVGSGSYEQSWRAIPTQRPGPRTHIQVPRLGCITESNQRQRAIRTFNELANSYTWLSSWQGNHNVVRASTRLPRSYGAQCTIYPLPPCTFLGYVRGLGAMFIFRIFRAIHRSLLHNSPFPPSTDT